MAVLLTIIHVLVCLFLIVVVLLQSGKAADLAGAFGGMGSQTAFGPRGSATLLSKATTVSAIIFMITSISLSIVAVRNSGATKTILQRQKSTKPPAPISMPQTPPAPAGQTSAPGKQPSATPGNGASGTVPLNIPPAPAGQGQKTTPQSAPPAKPAPKK